ncbi:MAG: DNA double-strand break repair nuclease NurA [Candidatus Hydrothermarchaeales archaeon]
MLDTTYEVLAKKREALKAKAEGLLHLEDADELRKMWRSTEFQEQKVTIGAEDGSINYRCYKSFVLYAVNALALVYDGNIREFEGSDVDLLHPYRVEQRLALYRSIFELKTSLQALDTSELFLIDGSLSSDLGTPKDFDFELNAKEKEEVLSLLPELEKHAGEIGVAIAAHGFAEQFKEKKHEKLAFLEYLEYLFCLERLFEKGMGKLVGVSKTSSKTSLMGELPDMAVFEKLVKESGYSEPLQEPLVSKLFRKFPAYDEFFNSLVFTSFYARLEDGKGVLLIEIPREVGEGEVVQILEKIRSTSVEGYPYLLRKAHRKVVISNKDIQGIFNSLGLLAKTGREVL